MLVVTAHSTRPRGRHRRSQAPPEDPQVSDEAVLQHALWAHRHDAEDDGAVDFQAPVFEHLEDHGMYDSTAAPNIPPNQVLMPPKTA